MGADVYLSPEVRYRLVVHRAHEDQVGPDAAPIDGEPMHYCGITIEHRTIDPDFDGRPGHISWREAGWCPGAVMWCDPNPQRRWTLERFEPLTLSPSIACSVHRNEFHIFIREGRVA